MGPRPRGNAKGRKKEKDMYTIFVTLDGREFHDHESAQLHCLDQARILLADVIEMKSSGDPAFADSLKQVVQWLEDADEDEDEDEDEEPSTPGKWYLNGSPHREDGPASLAPPGE